MALIEKTRRTPNIKNRVDEVTEQAVIAYAVGSQDTFYVGNLKGVGRIYQQTFIDMI